MRDWAASMMLAALFVYVNGSPRRRASEANEKEEVLYVECQAVF